MPAYVLGCPASTRAKVSEEPGLRVAKCACTKSARTYMLFTVTGNRWVEHSYKHGTVRSKMSGLKGETGKQSGGGSASCLRSLSGRKLPRPSTLRQVVQSYRRDHQIELGNDLRFYGRRTRSVEEAILLAVSSTDRCGRRHAHQRRIPKEALRLAAARLVRGASALTSSRSFADLLQVIQQIAGAVRGIGPLAQYDFALRIGARLGRKPERVYLHAGTRKGAAAVGLPTAGRMAIEMHELPRAFQSLTPWEAEDALCIFKDEIRRIQSVDRSGPRDRRG